MAGTGGLTEESLTQLVYDLLAIEAAAREAQINQEILSRQQGDESNQQLITAETQQRITAIAGLQTSSNQSITRIDGNVTQLQTTLNQAIQNLSIVQNTSLDHEARLDVIEGSETTVGSIAKALLDAKAYTDLKVSELIDNAPAILDTLKELSDALGGDGNFVTTINNSIAAETSARQAQVLALQGSIASLGGSLGNELETEINNIEASILAETSARQTADIQTLSDANNYSDSNKQDILTLLSQTIIKRQKIILTAQHVSQGFVELPHIDIVAGSLDAFMDRLGVFENEDFELSEVAGKTRMTFINSFAGGGDEEIEEGAELRVKYWTV